MKCSKTITAILAGTMIFSSSMLMTGCQDFVYSRFGVKRLETDCGRIAKKYCEDSDYQLLNVKAVTKVQDLGSVFLTNYCEFNYSDGEQLYGGYINADTEEIYTTEHLDEFCEVAKDFVEDELDISVESIDIRLRLENVESKYVPKASPNPYIDNRLLPVDLDSYDEYIDYLYDSNRDDDLCLIVRGRVDDSVELFELGYEYRQEIRDKYGLILDMDLENNYESYYIDDFYCTSSVYAPIDIDDIHLLVEYKRCFDNRTAVDSNEYDVDELASRISVSRSDDELLITLDKIDDYHNKFRIVAYEGEEILNAIYMDISNRANLEWEERDDGSYIATYTFRFDEEFKKK